MSAPLPKSIAVPPERPSAAHTGLWFDKFCNRWSDGWKLDAPAKLQWIQTITDVRVGDEKLLSEHVNRLTSLVRSGGGEIHHFKTAGRFATGLGREHPIENGFVWHPTLGVPYLPGSSVKGLVRAWATSWANKTDDHAETLARIFGPREPHAPFAQVGSVIFFDALPTAPVQLAADVMTPHYGPYYSAGEVPGDWHSPVPIPFLTVADSQRFLFALVPRIPSDQDQGDSQKAIKWLEEALLELGAGAKTAVGYGRFVKFGPKELAASEAASTAAKSPRYKTGQKILTQRIADPKDKGRQWFQADDGFGGVVTGGTPPQIEVGQTVELEIASVMQGAGYNFRLPRRAVESSKTKPNSHRR